jgi:hypothetical protein
MIKKIAVLLLFCIFITACGTEVPPANTDDTPPARHVSPPGEPVAVTVISDGVTYEPLEKFLWHNGPDIPSATGGGAYFTAEDAYTELTAIPYTDDFKVSVTGGNIDSVLYFLYYPGFDTAYEYEEAFRMPANAPAGTYMLQVYVAKGYDNGETAGFNYFFKIEYLPPMCDEFLIRAFSDNKMYEPYRALVWSESRGLSGDGLPFTAEDAFKGLRAFWFADDLNIYIAGGDIYNVLYSLYNDKFAAVYSDAAEFTAPAEPGTYVICVNVVRSHREGGSSVNYYFKADYSPGNPPNEPFSIKAISGNAEYEPFSMMVWSEEGNSTSTGIGKFFTAEEAFEATTAFEYGKNFEIVITGSDIFDVHYSLYNDKFDAVYEGEMIYRAPAEPGMYIIRVYIARQFTDGGTGDYYYFKIEL